MVGVGNVQQWEHIRARVYLKSYLKAAEFYEVFCFNTLKTILNSTNYEFSKWKYDYIEKS